MKKKMVKVSVASILLIGLASLFYTSAVQPPESESMSAGMGNVNTLQSNFEKWEAEYEKQGGDRNMNMPIGWFKGLSNEFSAGKGFVKLDLEGGTVSANITGLPSVQAWDVWLVDNRQGATIMPEPEDQMIFVGNLKHNGKSAQIEVQLGEQAFKDFEPDLVVVSRTGMKPTESRVLLATTTLFHRLHRDKVHGKSLVTANLPPAPEAKRSWLGSLMHKLLPTAEAQGPLPNPTTPLELLITQGRDLFLNQTFSGNGRTCATCHREEKNMTINPQFIATLPDSDPLFVGENNPNLGPKFENPRLLREFGLILENVDGFEDLNNKFVMRGVPSLLAISTSLRATFFDGTSIPPNERLGYGGDGAPGTGTLREFAIGAIIQHFTKSLNRVAGTDFRLPTNAELDALEAFQRSLGRQSDPDLSTMHLKSVVAARGLAIFNDQTLGKCSFCHANGGATIFSGPLQGVNANFNIGVQRQPDNPATLTGQPNPPDAGFGRNPNPNGGFGNGTFNTLTVIEAADTGPFFHDNSIATIEGAVEFYNSNAFNTSPGVPPSLRIHLETTQVVQVAAFLRVLNALENIRSSVDLASRAKLSTNTNIARELLTLSLPEIDDAIDVLQCGGLHQDAQAKLKEVKLTVVVALLAVHSKTLRDRKISDALDQLADARSTMVE